MFICDNQWTFERFQYFKFETNFLQNGNRLHKIGLPFSKIEKASFLYKATILESNVTTNNMAGSKWTYQKERSFASNYFIFLKILFQFKNLLERVDFMYQRPVCPYSYFLVSAGVLFNVAFSL